MLRVYSPWYLQVESLAEGYRGEADEEGFQGYVVGLRVCGSSVANSIGRGNLGASSAVELL